LTKKVEKKKLGLLLFAERTIRRATTIHYTAERERDKAPSKFQNLPSVVIPNGVDLAHFLSVPEKKEDNYPIHLLISGRVHPVKGFDLLVPAIAEVRRKNINVDLTIAGPDEGGYCNHVRAMVATYEIENHVRFTGNLNVDDLVTEYQRADIVVAPSYQESFGMAVAEAMAAGRPLIVSEAVNIAPEVATAKAGLVVPLNSVALAQAIKTLVLSPAECAAMGKRGRHYAQENYSTQSVATKMISLYRSVMRSCGSLVA
jgi:glycosyltransferase involved in cell wall biosynthesis